MTPPRTVITVGLPEPLLASLTRRAAREHRSRISLILHLLEQAIAPPVAP